MRSGLLCIAVLLSSACASGDGLQEKLRDSSASYNRSLRWGDLDRASEHLPAPSQPDFLTTHEDVVEDLVIVDYELLRLDLDKETGVAASRARVVWHTDREMIVRTTVVDQTWQFHEGKFVLVDERRRSGDPLTIFAENEEGEHPYLPGLLDFRRMHKIGEKQKKEARRGARASASQPAPELAHGVDED